MNTDVRTGELGSDSLVAGMQLPITGSAVRVEWATTPSGSQPARKGWEALTSAQREEFFPRFESLAASDRRAPLNSNKFEKLKGFENIWEVKHKHLNLRAIAFPLGQSWFITYIGVKPKPAKLQELARDAEAMRRQYL